MTAPKPVTPAAALLCLLAVAGITIPLVMTLLAHSPWSR